MNEIEHIKVQGHTGTWYEINRCERNGKICILLESEQHGDEAYCIITDENFKVILDEVSNGFIDLDEYLDDRADKNVILYKDTVIDRLVMQSISDGGIDLTEILRNGHTGYAERSCEDLMEVYNAVFEDTNLIHIIGELEDWGCALGDDDVVLINNLISEEGDWIGIGTKCTVMDIDQMQDSGERYNVVQADNNGQSIKCQDTDYMKCSDIE